MRDGRSHTETRLPVRPRARSYLERSASPLYCLVFLAPLIVAFEIGAVMALSGEDGQAKNVAAHSIMMGLFAAFGDVGGRLPAVVLVATLLAWHMARWEPWRVRVPVLLGMLLESVAYVVPLLIANVVLSSLTALVATSSPGTLGAALGAVPGGNPLDLPLDARLTISIGAGLYEEFLFRVILLTAVHRLLVDVVGLTLLQGRWAAVVLTALAFAWYHEAAAGVAGVDWGLFFFFTLAGVYFGLLYLSRGFGIVAATHAFYDIFVLVLLPRG